jgi:hypothetical protein
MLVEQKATVGLAKGSGDAAGQNLGNSEEVLPKDDVLTLADAATTKEAFIPHAEDGRASGSFDESLAASTWRLDRFGQAQKETVGPNLSASTKVAAIDLLDLFQVRIFRSWRYRTPQPRQPGNFVISDHQANQSKSNSPHRPTLLRAPRTMTILLLDIAPLWHDARFHR